MYLLAVFGQYKVVPKDRSARDNIKWTAGMKNPLHEACITRRTLRAWVSKGGRSRYQNNSKRGIRKMRKNERGDEGADSNNA